MANDLAKERKENQKCLTKLAVIERENNMNAERVEELKNLWSEGLSASQIAKRLGDVTRNAVIGKVHRLGLEARLKPVKKQVSIGQLDSNLISVSYSGNLAFKDISSDDLDYSSNVAHTEPKSNNLHSVGSHEYVSILK